MLETVLSIAMLAGFIWAVRFLLPKALKEHDAMALTCAVLTAVLALLCGCSSVWERARGTPDPRNRTPRAVHVLPKQSGLAPSLALRKH
jgi:hypothetical protein